MKAFELTDIMKRFGGTKALNGASFSCDNGEIHGLIGENGAGKSTMVKIVSGVYKPDSGSIKIRGEAVALKNPYVAVQQGIVVVHQELSLVPDLTVAENLFLPKPPLKKFKFNAQNDIEKKALKFFGEIGIKGIHPDDKVGVLTLRSKQVLEIAKAIYRQPKILILDEPTSALSIEEVNWLSQILHKLRQEGLTVVYISHRLSEIKELCNRFTILRNGEEVGTYRTYEIEDDEVIRLMIGRSLSAIYPSKPTENQKQTPAIEIQNLKSESGLSGVNLTLYRQEVLGIAGLEGQGQRALFRCLFGIEHLSDGKILINGKHIRIRHPRDAIHARIGLTTGLVPEDRKTEGLFLDLSIANNVTLPIIDNLSKFGWIDNNDEHLKIKDILRKVNVDLEVFDLFANSLSGGNQQKVVIAKWMLAACNNMLMYDPTRGVDVGTKFEIYNLIRDMAAEGNSVLIYSSELPELVNLCDRVLALYDGKVVDEFNGDNITEEALLSAIMGIDSIPISA
jgi:ribose transport system ATP-binding protein